MKKILFTGLIGILASVQGQAQWVHDWSRSLGGTSNDQGQCITSDANNYSISSGWFNGTADFDPSPLSTHNLVSAGGTDMYIEKLSNTGTLMWVKQIGGTGTEIPESITLIPGGGDVFVCGHFSGTTDFNYGGTAVTKTAVGGEDMFVARYDILTGNLVWVTTWGSTGTDQAWDILYDANDLLVSGTIQGNVSFSIGGSKVTLTTNAGSQDALIMRLNTSGGVLWAKNFGGSGTDIAYGICTDYTTYVYACGTFEGTADFDPGVPTYNIAATGSQDMFLGRYTLAAGAFSTWAWGTGTTNGIQRAKDIAYNYVTGYVYLTGTVSVGTITWPNSSSTTYTIAGLNDAFLLCYNSSGNYVWGSGYGSAGNDEGTDITCDQATGGAGTAYVYVCGNFTNTVDFDISSGGTTSLASAGQDDFYMLRYNGSGTFKDVGACGSTGRDLCYGICANQTMQFIYVTGCYMLTVDMDPSAGGTTNRTSAGGSDIFHNRYSWTTPTRLMNPGLAGESTISAFPNPATDMLNVENVATGSAVELYSLDGKKSGSWIVENSDRLVIDVSDLANGVYLLRMQKTDGSITTERIVIKH